MQFPALPSLVLLMLCAPALSKPQNLKDDNLIYAGMLMSADMPESSGNGPILTGEPEPVPAIIEKPKARSPPKPQPPPAMPDGTCPFACQCTLRVVQCSDLGLETIPQDIPTDTRLFDLQNNKITEIKQNDFKGLVVMHTLVLLNNQISKVHPKAFKSLVFLHKLYLSKNMLEEVPSNMPDSLIELRIHENHIKKVPKSIFKAMKNLHVMEMSANPLQSTGIEPGAFDGLDGLTYIRISNAHLTQIPKDLPPSIRELHLDQNNISAIEDEDLIHYSNLARLGLDHNHIKVIQNGTLTQCPNLRELHLQENQLERVPPNLPELKHLNRVYLNSNHITEIHADDFCPKAFHQSKRALYVAITMYDNPVKYWDAPRSAFRCVTSHSAVHFGNNYRK
uniref:biglycan-like n=1 Tax=Myxine glutinosa TaxID=7769 RepID=UPI00358E575C